jgi:hypothetical protein
MSKRRSCPGFALQELHSRKPMSLPLTPIKARARGWATELRPPRYQNHRRAAQSGTVVIHRWLGSAWGTPVFDAATVTLGPA